MRAPFHRWLGGMLLGILLAACTAQPADAGRTFGFGFRHKTQTIVPQPAPPVVTADTYDTTMGSSVDTNGFTSLPLRVGAHRFYVKATGNDANDCLTPAAACATTSHAWTLMTGGVGDQMLIEEGDTLAQTIPNGSFSPTWLAGKSGFSAAYPTVISSYDPADPTNEAHIGRGEQRSGRPKLTAAMGQLGGSGNYIAIKGLDFDTGTGPGQGTGFIGATNYVLIENNIFRYNGLTISDGGDGVSAPTLAHYIVRNNSFYGTWTDTTANVGNVYVQSTSDFTFEDNLNDHSGWRIGGSRDDAPASAANGGSGVGGGPTVFKHPIYIQANANRTIVRRNLFSDGAADGGIVRGDNTTWTENVSLHSPAGTGVGPGNSVEWGAYPSGVHADVGFNLSLAAIDLNSTNPSGYGYTLDNVAPGSRVHHNLLINSLATMPGNAQAFGATGGTAFGVPSQHTYVEVEFNTSKSWNSSGQTHTESSTPIHSSYTNNIWDDPASGSNVNSATPGFTNAYSESALYAAAGYGSFAAVIADARDHPEKHIQRTLRALAFAGYNVPLNASAIADQTAPTLTSPTGASTGTGTATVSATTNEGNGVLYYIVSSSATPPVGSQIKMGVLADGSAALKVGALAVSSSGAQSSSLTSLPTGTLYAYFTHEDASGNKSAVASSASWAETGLTIVTWNPADMSGAGISLDASKLVATTSGGTQVGVRANVAISQKSYWEAHVDLNADGWAMGVADSSASFTGSYWGNGGNAHVSAPFASGTGATMMYAVDPVAKKFWYGHAGTWTNGDPVAGTGGASIATFIGSAYPAFQGDSGDKATANFGAAAYSFTPPTGYGNVQFLGLFVLLRRRKKKAANDNEQLRAAA